ncbi:hypothetical protein [Desulfosporosinus youngiae]|uniref:hypothetical protein n=1 Tax=Desulfosporosinus youngiae TaxID=339862 RepID=UPI0002FB5A69|nr:hypothetical protein [Desulfosporosinus youngiae]
MKEKVYYWSDTCNRKAMAEAAVQEVRRVYAHAPVKKTRREGKPDFWRDGLWLKYLEERVKILAESDQSARKLGNS